MTTFVLAQNGDAATAGLFAVLGIFYLAFLVLMIASMWKIFTKAGEEGWKSIIPIYNAVVLMQIIGRPVWWVALFFLAIIPIIGSIAVLVLAFIVCIDLAKSFGKDTGFGVGIALLGFIFMPILAFGDARYLGPAGPEPRPGYPNVGSGGGAYGQQGIAGGYGQQQPYGQPGAAQGWGQQPQQPQGDWGQQPQQPQGDWGQQQPQQGGWGSSGSGSGSSGWGQQPQQGGWPQQPQSGDPNYPPPPIV